VRPQVIDVHGHVYPDGLPRLEKAMIDDGLALMVNLSGGDLEDLAPTASMTAMFPGVVAFYNVD